MILRKMKISMNFKKRGRLTLPREILRETGSYGEYPIMILLKDGRRIQTYAWLDKDGRLTIRKLDLKAILEGNPTHIILKYQGGLILEAV